MKNIFEQANLQIVLETPEQIVLKEKMARILSEVALSKEAKARIKECCLGKSGSFKIEVNQGDYGERRMKKIFERLGIDYVKEHLSNHGSGEALVGIYIISKRKKKNL